MSTYRKAGARMLMTESAWLAGAISGGCLEGELLRKAWWRTAQEQAVLITYDAAREDNDSDEAPSAQPVRWGCGLGCDGSIDVLPPPNQRGSGRGVGGGFKGTAPGALKKRPAEGQGRVLRPLAER